MKWTTMLLVVAGVPVVTGLVATGLMSMMAPPLVTPADAPASPAAPIAAPVVQSPPAVAAEPMPAATDGSQAVAVPGQPMLDPAPMLDPTPPGEQPPAPAQPQPGESGVAETTVLG